MAFSYSLRQLGIKIGDSTSEKAESKKTNRAKLHTRIAPRQKETIDGKISEIFTRCIGHVKSFFSKLLENKNCENHKIRQKHALGKVKKAVKEGFKELTNCFRTSYKRLQEGRVVRDLKDAFSLFGIFDFSFEKVQDQPFKKESYDEEQKKHFAGGVFDYTLSDEELLAKIIERLQEIGEISFTPSEYALRNALVAELIAKEMAHLNIKEGFSFPFPTFTKEDVPIVATYFLEKKIEMGESGIPALWMTASPVDGIELPPLLVFRGTRLRFDNPQDLRSVVENLHVCGPGRGVYNEFKGLISYFLKLWYRNTAHKEKIRVFGYSQGAVQGQRVLVDFANYIQSAPLYPSLFYNSPAVEGEYAKQWHKIDKKTRPVAFHYVVTNDVISKSGREYLGEVFEVKPAHVTFMSAHFGNRLFENSWELYHVDKPKETQSPSRLFINQLMSSSAVASIYKMAKRGIEKFMQAPHKYEAVTEHADVKNMKQ